MQRFFFLWFKCHHRFLGQFLILAVQKISYRFICKTVCFHRIPTGKTDDLRCAVGELQSQIRSIQQEKISGDNIYRLLLAFDEVYHSATEAEQKEFMKAFIERIEMFSEKRKDGSWIKKIEIGRAHV